MSDIFDEIEQENKGDIFDRIESDFLTSSAIAQPQKKTMTEKISKKVIQGISLPLTNPVTQKLEDIGKKVKSSVQESLSNIASYPTSPKISPELKAIPLTGLSAITEAAPFTPSEQSIAIGSEMIPITMIKSVIGKFPKSLVNRFFNAPKDIAEGRLLKGKVPLGEEVLENPRLRQYRINDKKEIFNRAFAEIKKIGVEVKKKINNFPESFDISSQELADSINPLIQEVKDSFGDISREARRLTIFKKAFMSGKPDFLDFKSANNLRESLGESIGKRFGKEMSDIPELLQAQRMIYAKLRDKISRISPDLSDLLSQQHVLFEIKRSVMPAAAKGFEKIPQSGIGLLTAPIDANVKLANQLKNLSEARGVGGIGASSKSLSDIIREKYNQ